MWYRLKYDGDDTPFAGRIARHAADNPYKPMYVSNADFVTVLQEYGLQTYFDVCRQATVTTLFGVEIILE